jgi:hypothetical protein
MSKVQVYKAEVKFCQRQAAEHRQKMETCHWSVKDSHDWLATTWENRATAFQEKVEKLEARRRARV